MEGAKTEKAWSYDFISVAFNGGSCQPTECERRQDERQMKVFHGDTGIIS
jgi:hypothetical protein